MVESTGEKNAPPPVEVEVEGVGVVVSVVVSAEFDDELLPFDEIIILDGLRRRRSGASLLSPLFLAAAVAVANDRL